MENNPAIEKRYVYFQIECWYGEYKETISVANPVDHQQGTPFEPMHIADEYAQMYYNPEGDNPPDETDTGIYEFNNGDIKVEATLAHEISKDLFDVLQDLNNRSSKTDFTQVFFLTEQDYINWLNPQYSTDDIYTDHKYLIHDDEDRELAGNEKIGELFRKNDPYTFLQQFHEWKQNRNS